MQDVLLLWRKITRGRGKENGAKRRNPASGRGKGNGAKRRNPVPYRRELALVREAGAAGFEQLAGHCKLRCPALDPQTLVPGYIEYMHSVIQ